MGNKKIGLVVEGGGMKCAYGAGILDRLLDEKAAFDYCIGVSAGAANAASFLAGQRERNLRFYTIHVKDPHYISVRNYLHDGQVFGLQYIYGTMSNAGGIDPLDYDAVMANPCEYEIVATDAKTGRARYFNKSDLRRDDIPRLWHRRHFRYSVSRSNMGTAFILMAEYPIQFRCAGHLKRAVIRLL